MVQTSRPTFSIRQLCREFEVTPRSLRFYEDKGLLAPARAGQNRVYSHRDRGRLKLILQGKRIGLSLTEIGDLLDLYDHDDGGAIQMAEALPAFRRKLADLRQQRLDIEEAIIMLTETCERLEARLADVRPDLLPQAADYEQVLRARLDGVHAHAK
ncbi:MAG: transcriptional regulator [Caulobacterales bacterium 68-7]|nr:MAG: transcriptional regulator [Caulobacterales bacterium 68-7]